MSTTPRPFDLFDVAERTSDADAVDAPLIETDDDTLIDVTLGECCNGGALELRCKLCAASPTYWRRAEDGP